MATDSIAIIGAGQAGAALAARLRQAGFQGGIDVFGAESAPPYQRPPLSKKYLAGDWEQERLWLRPAQFWREQGIALHLGGTVEALDLASRTLRCNGQRHGWRKLALTTGAAPRPLPAAFAGRSNVFELRNLADVQRLQPAFLAGRRLLVLGGGYIGLETAAVAAQAGLSVQVVERASRVLERVACPATAAAIRALHQRHGVLIHEGRTVAGTEGDEALTGVELDNGQRIACDLVVAGVGVAPQTALAEAAGIDCDDGILVDAYGRTSAPDVWAAGDCARFVLGGEPARLESVQNAIDQAEAVADDMLGQGRPYQPVPWFWSDQYDMKLQIVGLNRGYDAVVSHASAKGESHWYFRADRLISVDALNDGRAYMVGKKLLEAGRAVGRGEVERPGFEPMQLLRDQAEGRLR
ncbi:NAD(P)/FAD-dependent oxidoreductase [Bordetella bronchiseptica]|uniref:NAD(P)/FAD-dependent oxidoreductase n=1 Tax=Bordetella bronchiseptica TaxID=518 RepID=UPI00045946F6|nr:FAD-dependent oxidoreductase [Bordetella bronchiseptica]KCV56130.1 pyridine nucleotide-disulfide oxidoreductase [Bordetella bronchiseptica 7E71]